MVQGTEKELQYVAKKFWKYNRSFSKRIYLEFGDEVLETLIQSFGAEVSETGFNWKFPVSLF